MFKWFLWPQYKDVINITWVLLRFAYTTPNNSKMINGLFWENESAVNPSCIYCHFFFVHKICHQVTKTITWVSADESWYKYSTVCVWSVQSPWLWQSLFDFRTSYPPIRISVKRLLSPSLVAEATLKTISSSSPSFLEITSGSVCLHTIIKVTYLTICCHSEHEHCHLFTWNKTWLQVQQRRLIMTKAALEDKQTHRQRKKTN